MKQVVIENPILNSPFEEPTRHFRFADEGITNEIVAGRRSSSYFVPIAKPRKKGVKNQDLGFTIPYTLNGEEKNYVPDFVACLDDGHGLDDLLNLVVEVSGEAKKDKAAKASTARALWVPAINNHGRFGRWAFLEIADPWDAQNAIRAGLQAGAHHG